MDGNSFDIKAQKLEELRVLFPDVFSEGKIDFDRFKTALGEDSLVHGKHYELSWAGKTDARKEVQKQTTATLIPDREGSIDFDASQNIFIEGENLEVLRTLQKAYAGKVKVIYIDPPYNTGNDSFVYPDDYSERREEYDRRTGKTDDEGYLNKQDLWRKNSRESGQFHSVWLSMMYPRLYLARNLMQEDGVIFVSIDDNEQANLKLLMDDVFGEENLLAQFIWRTDGNFDNQAKVKVCHEYVLAYCKNIDRFPSPPVIDFATGPDSKLFKAEIRNTIVKNGPANPISEIVLPAGFPAGFVTGKISLRDNAWPHYLNEAVIENGVLRNEVVIRSGWSSKELILSFIENDFNPIFDSKGQETSFVITKSGGIEVLKKRKEDQSHVISVLTNVGNTQATSASLRKERIYFDYPKPVQLIKYFLSMNVGTEYIAIDFFGGSGTLAEAVLQLNWEDGGNRNFVLVQMPEPTDEGSEAYKAGYKTIADISRARIQKVIQKLQGEREGKLALEGGARQHLGFKSYKLAPSNFNIWRGDVAGSDAIFKQLELHIQAEKEGSADEAMLHELILKSGLPLTTPVESLSAGDATIFKVAEGALAICFARHGPAITDALLALQPQKVIMLNSCFERDESLTNFKLQLRDADIDLTII